MIKEALEYLHRQILKEEIPQLVDVKGPDDRKTFLMPDGTTNVAEAEPEPLTLNTRTIMGFADMCVKHKVLKVVYERGQFVGYIDREGREVVTLEAVNSNEFNNLLHLFNVAREQNQGIPVADLVFMLNCDLRPTIGEEDRLKLINQVSKIRVSTHESVGKSKARGQDTMGIEIDRQVSPDVDLPHEVITFRPTVLSGSDMQADRFKVQAYIEPNLDHKTWVIREIPDSISKAQRDALALMADRLGSELAVDLDIVVSI